LSGGFVTHQSRQFGALAVQERLVALRARHLEPGFGRRALDLSHRLHSLRFTKGARSGDQRRELTESRAASAASSQPFPRESHSFFTMTKSEVRGRHRREHGTFPVLKTPFPSDRQRLFERFKRIVPCTTQKVRDPEALVAH